MGEKRKDDKAKMKPKKMKEPKHMDKKEDMAMMKKVVKKGCMK